MMGALLFRSLPPLRRLSTGRSTRLQRFDTANYTRPDFNGKSGIASTYKSTSQSTHSVHKCHTERPPATRNVNWMRTSRRFLHLSYIARVRKALLESLRTKSFRTPTISDKHIEISYDQQNSKRCRYK